LLALLGITKQSLGRALKPLEARGLVITRPGGRDRRQKELRLTAEGKALEAALFTPLRDAMGRAYTAAGQDAVTGFWRVSEALIPARERKRVAGLGES
jgi:DNA-binding MarR family transcriptional regulator